MALTPLVAMKSKTGELESLRQLAERDAPVPRVVVELLDSVEPDGPGRLLKALVQAAARMVNLRQPLWIDTELVSRDAPLARHPGGVFELLDDRIETALTEEHGLFAPDVPAFVPVLSASPSDDQLRRVALLQEHRPRPVVIRFRDVRLPPGEVDDCLRRISPSARGNPMHAVVDLGFVEAVHPRQLALTRSLVRTLGDRLGPSSTTVLAGSIPAARHGFVTTVRERTEVALWHEVAHLSAIDVNYGDYGVVHPARPAPAKPGPRTIYPYLYYTVPNLVIALRRQPAKEDGKLLTGEAFTELADELVARPDFAGSGYSWGDRELAGCRREGGRSARHVSRWVAMAMSHHLAHLARRPPAEL
ncbi:beta family protein [Lentzea sp.]|uniref:beta family protein n=1 Tax=Lentzea sp. TaxID=56099 RepID=UPI002ED3531F